MINIGKYIEMAINWLTENFTLFFDAINVGIGGFIDGFQNVLMWIPFYITIVLLTLLAWYKSGKGVGVFTVFGLLLIWSMGFWNETMQTLALVLSSTIIALIIGLPLGIWPPILAKPYMLLYPALADQLRQGPLYGRAGEAQVFGHSADSVPALAVLVCPVVEVDQHLLGPGAQFRVIVDLVKVAHLFPFSFPV